MPPIEVGKVLERIVAYKITSHLSHIGTDISENQFGSQTGRSSIDLVANYDQATVTQGGLAQVLLIDIVNAFNSFHESKY